MSAFKTGEDIVKALAETRQKYNEEWATTSNNYIIGVPSKDKLIKRTQMIDEIYEIQK